MIYRAPILNRRMLIAGGSLSLAGACSPSAQQHIPGVPAQSLTALATSAAHMPLMEFVRSILQRDGLDFSASLAANTDAANLAVERGACDVACFESRVELAAFNAAHNGHLVEIAGVEIAPLIVFSTTHRGMDDIVGGEIVAIPTEPQARGRALLLLYRVGLIELTDPNNAQATVADITVNAMRLDIRTMPEAQMPAAAAAGDIVVGTAAQSRAAGVDPFLDAIFIEDNNSRFTNFLVTRSDRARDARVLQLAAALTSQETANFLEQSDDVRPAF